MTATVTHELDLHAVVPPRALCPTNCDQVAEISFDLGRGRVHFIDVDEWL